MKLRGRIPNNCSERSDSVRAPTSFARLCDKDTDTLVEPGATPTAIMHVCIVDTTLTTPPTGGAQTFLVELCRAFVHKGWRVTIVTQPGPERSVLASLSDVGAEVRDQIWHRAHLPEERGQALAAWVNSERPDAYVVSISPDVGWLALPLLEPSIPTISIAHNDVE